MMSRDTPRRLRLDPRHFKRLNVGDQVRNWELLGDQVLLFPYDPVTLRLLSFPPKSYESQYLKSFADELSNRPTFTGTFAEDGKVPYQFHQLPVERAKNPSSLALAQIATHGHFVFDPDACAFNEKAPLMKLPSDSTPASHHLLAALLNSSAALFWLKQVCFNKGAGEDEERDRFEYAGGKVEKLPISESVAESLRGKHNVLAERLEALSQACWERGRQMPALAMKKLFEKPGEAYHEWNSSLSGYVVPDPRLGGPFQTAEDLKAAFSMACLIREGLRSEMVALQEEMDWLVYAAYGLIPADSTALRSSLMPTPLAREQRPFVLWAEAGGDFEKAIALIPAEWSEERKAHWRARLEAIRDNEHIHRIEQPVYKRRWDEQWKVGNRWQCGPVAYDAAFVDAFEWWLSEKAEWWLEKKRNGGPVPLDDWTTALWQDTCVQTAWGVVSEALGRLQKRADFTRYFAALVKEQSVLDDIPAAVPWDELEKKRKIPAAVKRIRGKLNVPRERFRVTNSGEYVWAGMK
jgi:hypothetical protein